MAGSSFDRWDEMRHQFEGKSAKRATIRWIEQYRAEGLSKSGRSAGFQGSSQ